MIRDSVARYSVTISTVGHFLFLERGPRSAAAACLLLAQTLALAVPGQQRRSRLDSRSLPSGLFGLH